MSPLRKLALTLLIILLVVIALTGCTERVLDKEQISPDQKIVIKFSHVVAENTPKGMAAQRFARLVEKRSHGRVEVQVFPNSTLYADGEEMQALKDEAVHIIAPATSKLAGLFPCWQLLDLPYAFEDAEAVHKALEGPIGKELTESLERQDLLALAFWDNGFKQLTNSIRPIIYPEDLAGLKFRVMINNSILKEQFSILGAYPVPFYFKDVYRSLEKNEVQGQENTLSNIYSKKFYQVQPYMTLTNHGYMGYVVLTNKKFWNSIPVDVREMLKTTMQEVTKWEHMKAEELNQSYYEQLKNNNKIKITTLTRLEREMWEEAFSPLYSSLSKEIGVDLINQLIKERNSNNLKVGGETF